MKYMINRVYKFRAWDTTEGEMLPIIELPRVGKVTEEIRVEFLVLVVLRAERYQYQGLNKKEVNIL